MDIESKLRELRVLTRTNTKVVVDHLVRNFINRSDKSNTQGNKCIVCGSSEDITKEHVLPQWVFGSDPQKFFTTDINSQNQAYISTTVPACKYCNNDLLSSLDDLVCTSMKRVNLDNDFFDPIEFDSILRWLEIIDYKFQVLNFIRTFKRHKKSAFVPYLADFPLTMLRDRGKGSHEVITELRRSRKRVTIKNKFDSYNSLIFLKSKNTGFHFFHQMDEFIFIEFGSDKKALFYFYKQTFDTVEEATEEAKKVVALYY